MNVIQTAISCCWDYSGELGLTTYEELSTKALGPYTQSIYLGRRTCQICGKLVGVGKLSAGMMVIIFFKALGTRATQMLLESRIS